MEQLSTALMPQMQELFISSARLLYDKKKGRLSADSATRREEIMKQLRDFLEYGEMLTGKDRATFQAMKPMMLCFFECLFAKVFESAWVASTLSRSLSNVANPRDYLFELATSKHLTKEVRRQLEQPELQVFFAEALTIDKEARLRLFNNYEIETLLTETAAVSLRADNFVEHTGARPQVETIVDKRPLVKTKKFWFTLGAASTAAACLAVLGTAMIQDYYKDKMLERQDRVVAEKYSQLIDKEKVK